jgi:hypothetical protein
VIPGNVRSVSGTQLDHISVCGCDLESELMTLAVRMRRGHPDLHPSPTAQNIRDQGWLRRRRVFGSGEWWQVFGHSLP